MQKRLSCFLRGIEVHSLTESNANQRFTVLVSRANLFNLVEILLPTVFLQSNPTAKVAFLFEFKNYKGSLPLPYLYRYDSSLGCYEEMKLHAWAMLGSIIWFETESKQVSVKRNFFVFRPNRELASLFPMWADTTGQLLAPPISLLERLLFWK